MFQISKKLKNSLGRAGVLVTPHGEIQTPAFVAVGTKATIKSLTPEQVKEAGSQVILANTYHLYLEPGEKVVKEAGGLHDFMNWQGPIMTDSGGFQAFSLGVAYGYGLSKFISSDTPPQEIVEEINNKRSKEGKSKKAKVTEEGIDFVSVLDGSKHFLSPEKSIQIQNNLGADIIFALDEFTSPHADFDNIKSTIERTGRWAERCLTEHKKFNIKNQNENFDSSSLKGSHGTQNFHSGFFAGSASQQLFGIVQGGRYEDLRKESAKNISSFDFGGFGIGGTFVKEDMATAVKWVNEILPEEKPRHLLGVGEPIDLILGVENGCDTFDCVAPTRMARNGSLYTKGGKINITNAKYKNLFEPVEKDCKCYTCKNYTAAYISHLFRAKEMLAATLASIHNLYFLNNLMSQIRQSILDDNFFDFKEEFLKNYKS
jgi:queuine tRNA-ribosyltransferase